MSSYLQLTSHYVLSRPGGMSVNNALITVTLGNGTSVQFAMPFMPIGGGLALVPRITTDGESGIRFDVSRWSPACLTGSGGVVLPVELPDQALVARLCREFHASPDISWADPIDDIRAWLRAWYQTNNVDH